MIDIKIFVCSRKEKTTNTRLINFSQYRKYVVYYESFSFGNLINKNNCVWTQNESVGTN